MPEDDERTRREIRKEVQRVEESARYASETQFEYAKRWRRVDRLIGGAAAVLAAVAGVGGLADQLSARWAGFVAILAAGVGAVAASIGAPQTRSGGCSATPTGPTSSSPIRAGPPSSRPRDRTTTAGPLPTSPATATSPTVERIVVEDTTDPVELDRFGEGLLAWMLAR